MTIQTTTIHNSPSSLDKTTLEVSMCVCASCWGRLLRKDMDGRKSVYCPTCDAYNPELIDASLPSQFDKALYTIRFTPADQRSALVLDLHKDFGPLPGRMLDKLQAVLGNTACLKCGMIGKHAVTCPVSRDAYTEYIRRCRDIGLDRNTTMRFLMKHDNDHISALASLKAITEAGQVEMIGKWDGQQKCHYCNERSVSYVTPWGKTQRVPVCRHHSETRAWYIRQQEKQVN